MKKNYSHLNNTYQEYDYSQTLLQKCTSSILWNNPFTVTFMYYLQQIIMTAALRIKFIKNYQNPIEK